MLPCLNAACDGRKCDTAILCPLCMFFAPCQMARLNPLTLWSLRRLCQRLGTSASESLQSILHLETHHMEPRECSKCNPCPSRKQCMQHMQQQQLLAKRVRCYCRSLSSGDAMAHSTAFNAHLAAFFPSRLPRCGAVVRAAVAGALAKVPSSLLWLHSAAAVTDCQGLHHCSRQQLKALTS